MGFAVHEILGDVLPWMAIAPCSVADGASINTYDASPQKTTSIDLWSDGANADKHRFQKAVLIVMVASMGGTGNIVPYWYDDDAVMTTASHAGATLAITFSGISSAGLYVSEVNLGTVWATNTSRVVADSTADKIRRYCNIRLTNSSGSASVLSAVLLLGKNLGSFPSVPSANILTQTKAA